MLNSILKSGLRLAVVEGRLSVKGPAKLLNAFRDATRRNKPELLKVLAGQSVDDVGQCDACGADLLGLQVRGGYVNRVCPECGEWFRCLNAEGTTGVTDGRPNTGVGQRTKNLHFPKNCGKTCRIQGFKKSAPNFQLQERQHLTGWNCVHYVNAGPWSRKNS